MCATMAEYTMFGGAMLGWLVTGLVWRGASWLGAMSLKKANKLVCYLGSMLALIFCRIML